MGNHPTGFSQLIGWEMVFMRGGQKAQYNRSFFKVTPLIWAIEDQNNKSYRGGWTLKKEEKFPLFKKIPNLEGGRGLSGEVGMVSQL